jgi:hypothetical protein
MTTQAIYEKRGTPITWTNTGGDELLNAKGLAAVTGRLGSFYDRGAGAAPGEYEIRGYTSWVSNPTVGDALQIVVVQSDGTHSDAGVAYHNTDDAALTLVALNACPGYVGSIIAHTADTAEKGGAWLVRITSRYFAVGVYNTSAGKTLTDTNSVTAIVATPIDPDVQAAA